MNRKILRTILVSFLILSISIGILWVYDFHTEENYGLIYMMQIQQFNSTLNKQLDYNYTVWVPFPENNDQLCNNLMDYIMVRSGNCTISFENTEKGYALKIVSSGFVWIQTKADLANHSDIRANDLTMNIDSVHIWSKINRTNNTTPIDIYGLFMKWEKVKHSNIFGFEHTHEYRTDWWIIGGLHIDGWEKIHISS